MSVNGITTEFLLDGANVVAETKNGSTTNYIRGVSGIISSSIQGTNNTTKYYTSDGHGNITKLTDSTGTIVKTYVYDAFGVEHNIDSNDTNPFRYCGEYYDREIGQIYLRARYYDPSLGRFTQSDPAMAGDNWYVYCSNDPINMIDPYGEDAIILTNEDAVNSGDYVSFSFAENINFGHQAALVQDENGTWYYFSCGEGYVTFEVVDPKYMTDLVTFSNEYYSAGTYTTSTYIKGDFTSCVEYFATYENCNSKDDNASYHYLYNNCTGVVMNGLLGGKLQDGTSVAEFLRAGWNVVPNVNKELMQMQFFNNAFTYQEYRKQINDQLWEAKNGVYRNELRAWLLEKLW